MWYALIVSASDKVSFPDQKKIGRCNSANRSFHNPTCSKGISK